MTGGLLAYFGTKPHKANAHAASQTAEWRGPLHKPVGMEGIGFVCAQGTAKAGRRGELAIGFHGRIDNLDELGQSLGTRCDGELDLVASLYRQHGDEFATELLGDFAIVLLDEGRGCLLASRDWIGMRPLFWLEHQGQTAVTSEIKQALKLFEHPMIPADQPHAANSASEPNEPDATIEKGVGAVPAFGYVLATRSAPTRTWTKPHRFEPIRADAEAARQETRRLLEIATLRRIPVGARTGAMMSGGVDSTAVAGVAAHLARMRKAPPLEACYTMALPELPDCDETVAARQVAESIGVSWKPVVIRIEDYKAWPERAFDLHDGPVFPTACGAAIIIREAAEDGIETLLTGLGGDEFADQAGVEFRQCLLRGEAREALRWVRSGQPGTIRSVLGATARAVRDYFLHGIRAETKYEQTARRFWTRYTLELIEREGAKHGLSVEAPFFDRELASFLAGLAPSVKSTPEFSKSLLRDAVADLVPESVRLNPRIVVYNSVIEAALGPVPGGQSLHQFIGRSYAERWMQQVNLMLKYGNQRPSPANSPYDEDQTKKPARPSAEPTSRIDHD